MLKAFEEEALTELQTKLDSLDPREKGRQYLIQREQEAEEKYAPPGVEFFKSLIPGQIEPAPEGAPDAVSTDLGLIDPIETLIDMSPLAAMAGLGLKTAKKALPESGLVSKLRETIETKMGTRAAPQEIESMLKGAGVKREEIEDTGIETWLREMENKLFDKQKSEIVSSSQADQDVVDRALNAPNATPKIEKTEVLSYLNKKQPRFKETTFGRLSKEDQNKLDKLKEERFYTNRARRNLIKRIAKDIGVDDLVLDNAAYAFAPKTGDAYNDAVLYDSRQRARDILLSRTGLSIDDFWKRLEQATELEKKSLKLDDDILTLESSNPTKWKKHSLKEQGLGKNYREYVYTLDNPRGTFQSSHWDDENVLYHIRAQDIEAPQIGRSLNVDEIQSDIHQKAQKSGYAKRDMTDEEEKKISEIIKLPVDEFNGNPNEVLFRAQYLPDDKYAEVMKLMQETGEFPDYPMKKAWTKNGMRRMLKEAVDGRYDSLTWTAGKHQAKRAGQGLEDVTGLRYTNDFLLMVYGKKGLIKSFKVRPQELSKYVGSDVAKKLKTEHFAQQKIRNEFLDKAKQLKKQISDHLKPQDGSKYFNSREEIEEFVNRSLSFNNELDIFDSFYTFEALGVPKNILNEFKDNFKEFDHWERTTLYPSVQGPNIEFGGSGMKKFYDERLVNEMNDEVKKYGGRVEKVTIDSPYGEKIDLWRIKITDKMRDTIKEKGQPLYAIPAAVGLGEVVREMKKEQESKKDY